MVIDGEMGSGGTNLKLDLDSSAPVAAVRPVAGSSGILSALLKPSSGSYSVIF